MTRALKIFIVLFSILIVIGAVVSVLGVILLNKSLPDYKAKITWEALNQPANVHWDRYRVPHISATNDLDLFRIQGYVHAQERLWQMDIMRRAAAGRLSELFGKETIELDVLMRTWGFYPLAEQVLDSVSEASQFCLNAYTEGINYFIETNNNKLPIEFSLLDYKPDTWKPVDSIAMLRLIAMQFGFSWDVEITKYRFIEQFGPEQTALLFPDSQTKNNTVQTSSAQHLARFQNAMFGITNILGLNRGSAVSNCWVIGPQKSKSGQAILANDPHLLLSAPNFWFENHLQSETYDVTGMSIPGIPAVVVGKNPAIAWGITNSMVDDLDFYFEQINPQDTEQYRAGNNWENFTFRTERIQVKNQTEPLFLDVRETKQRTVISNAHELLRGDSLVVSMRWAGTEKTDEILSLLLLNRSKNWQEFKSAFEAYGTPVLHFLYADSAGHIGSFTPGLIPVRRGNAGDVLHKSGDRAGEWVGYVPFSRLPQRSDPPEQFITAANTKMVDANYRYYLSNTWESASRLQRIQDLIETLAPLDADDCRLMQNDVFSLHAISFIAKMSQHMPIDSLTEDENQIWTLLQDWDGHAREASASATVFQQFFVELLHATLADQLDESLFNAFIRRTNVPIRAFEHLVELPNAIWWDDVKTLKRERMPDILLQAFQQAAKKLRGHLGDGPGFWEWGQVHRVTLHHPIGTLEPLDYIFDRGAYGLPGTANTINKAEYNYDDPFKVDIGASMRIIVDFAYPGTMWSILAGGQSGQPFSGHYDDQIELWRNGNYKTVSHRINPEWDRQEFRPH